MLCDLKPSWGVSAPVAEPFLACQAIDNAWRLVHAAVAMVKVSALCHITILRYYSIQYNVWCHLTRWCFLCGRQEWILTCMHVPEGQWWRSHAHRPPRRHRSHPLLQRLHGSNDTKTLGLAPCTYVWRHRADRVRPRLLRQSRILPPHPLHYRHRRHRFLLLRDHHSQSAHLACVASGTVTASIHARVSERVYQSSFPPCDHRLFVVNMRCDGMSGTRAEIDILAINRTSRYIPLLIVTVHHLTKTWQHSESNTPTVTVIIVPHMQIRHNRIECVIFNDENKKIDDE